MEILRSALRRQNAVFDAIDHVADRLYVSRHGAYSFERLYALESYCSQTCKLRVLVVCLTFSIPPLLVSIALELIPLENPDEGWLANRCCWTRLCIMSFVSTMGTFVEIEALLPNLSLSLWSMGCACFFISCFCTALEFAVAVLWVFPTPFLLFLGSIPWAFTTVSTFLLTIGAQRLKSQPAFRHQVLHRLNVIGVQASLLIVYCAFSTAYYRLPEHSKPFLMLALPIIELAMQHVVTWAMNDLEEYQPGVVVFCVGVFDALFMSECMQSSGARLTLYVIAGLSITHGLLGFRRLCRVTDRLEALAKACDLPVLMGDQFLSSIAQVIHEPDVLLSESGIQIRSPIHHRLSHLSGSRIKSPRRSATARSQGIRIAPAPSPINLTAISLAASLLPGSTADIKQSQQQDPLVQFKNEIIHTSLKMLFESEYHILVAYVNTIVPMMYAIYVAILGNLPSAAYYPDIRDKSGFQMETLVRSIVLYGGLQLLSFLTFQVIVKRKTGLSPAHVLAFVIENQTQELLGQLFVWYVLLLQFTLAHYGTQCGLIIRLAAALTSCLISLQGADFTLRFVWLKKDV